MNNILKWCEIFRYEDETDENQNTDPYDPLTKERKSQTLDTRSSRLKNQFRNAIGRRKSSTTLLTDPEKVVKTRRESFIQKIFKKPSPKVEKEVEAVESDIDDPLYDTIDHAKTSAEPEKHQRFGSKILLPEGTMAELKEKLRSKESLEQEVSEEKEPPALPPRGSLTALDGTTEVVIHQQPNDNNADDSEESDVSGHYQTISKTTKQAAQPLKETVTEIIEQPPVEAEYQVVNKDKKKKRPEKDSVENLENALEIPEKGAEGLAGMYPSIQQEVVVNLVTELKITEDRNELMLENRNQEKTQGEPSGDYQAPANPKQTEENVSENKSKEVLKQDMEKGLCDLNSLLLRLAEMSSAPLAERGGLASWSPEGELPPAPPRMVRSHSDPDYDIPRPHAPLALAEDFDEDRIQATQFFNKAEASSTGSTNSLEPDSLETKKESTDVIPE